MNKQTVAILIAYGCFMVAIPWITPMLPKPVFRSASDRQDESQRRLDYALERIETLENKVARLEANQRRPGNATDAKLKRKAAAETDTPQHMIAKGDSVEKVRRTLGEPWHKVGEGYQHWYYGCIGAMHGYDWVAFDNNIVVNWERKESSIGTPMR